MSFWLAWLRLFDNLRWNFDVFPSMIKRLLQCRIHSMHYKHIKCVLAYIIIHKQKKETIVVGFKLYFKMKIKGRNEVKDVTNGKINFK